MTRTRLDMKVTPEFYDSLLEAARREGTTISEYVRKAVEARIVIGVRLEEGPVLLSKAGPGQEAEPPKKQANFIHRGVQKPRGAKP